MTSTSLCRRSLGHRPGIGFCTRSVGRTGRISLTSMWLSASEAMAADFFCWTRLRLTSSPRSSSSSEGWPLTLVSTGLTLTLTLRVGKEGGCG